MTGRSSNAGTPNDLNKFTGHERDQEGGLDLDYMLARNYDSELGRFYSVDPLHFKYQSTSPYAYVLNNPLRLVDPTGMASEDPKVIARLKQNDISKGLQEMLNLMNESGNKKEVLAYLVQDNDGTAELLVIDISGNTESTSKNPEVGKTASGTSLFEGSEVIAQIHTHTNGNPTPSGGKDGDQQASRDLQAPVFKLTNDNMGVTLGGVENSGFGDNPNLGKKFKESVVNKGKSDRLIKYAQDLKGAIDRKRKKSK
jgi:RHS repeat-associated protein